MFGTTWMRVAHNISKWKSNFIRNGYRQTVNYDDNKNLKFIVLKLCINKL